MKRHITSLISQQFGRFASHAFSPRVQKMINKGYVKGMGLSMREFNAPESYPTLNALFTRTLNEPRDFSTDPKDVISPCDALITEFGKLDDIKALQIKGMSYSVPALLGHHVDSQSKARMAHGNFINFYLSPRDYHRYHIPMDLRVKSVTHIPGKFYPVNMPSLNKRVDLFIENERVVISCESDQGKSFFIVLVAALNVGKMQVSFEPRIKTNSNIRTPQHYRYDDLRLKKGEDFGCFEMGSTIVIIAESGMMDLHVGLNQKVRFGESIATLN